ncbi:hypothetical protein [Gluconobacter kondonii]|uniref:hypothetical protein n=1 Tax=Gluconobacter kondonii TaxID=941463 RepID=UPI001B8CAA1D|nr:hypothetical protein [Gluconobacter kondonii]MBS1065411.1 hypothetical protein [Gluconobacter kondonii]MBS1079992.1 hypothetical protein [Gluconobacter kondonii]MBS1082771.1 hypothetical protein [Gluconobacter kondonii]
MARAPDSKDIDPREIKILSDILALVLDEQPGHAATALERIRQMARRDVVTGGALKNLFITRIGTVSPQNVIAREKGLRDRVRDLEHRLSQSESDTRTAQSRLGRCQMDMGLLQVEVATFRLQKPWRYAALAFATGAGLLVGIAGTQFYHSLTTTRAVIDRATYLR